MIIYEYINIIYMNTLYPLFPSFRWLSIKFKYDNNNINILIKSLKKICNIKKIMVHVNIFNNCTCYVEINKWYNLNNNTILKKIENNERIIIVENNIAFFIKKELNIPIFNKILNTVYLEYII